MPYKDKNKQREAAKIGMKKYRKEHPEVVAASIKRLRSWTEKNKEKNDLYQKKYQPGWRRNNRVKLTDYQHNREAKKRKNGGFYTTGEWQTLKAQYNWRCPSCKLSEPTIVLTRDHIIPVSKGGSNNIENIQPLCMKCNLIKATKIIKF